MQLKDKLPISYLLFTTRGRINRFTYWTVSLFIWSSFYILNTLINSFFAGNWSIVIYPLLFWTLYATASKRLHDTNKSFIWLFIVGIPIAGPFYLLYLLGFKKGDSDKNNFGNVPNSAPDYFKNNNGDILKKRESTEIIINDVTRINPVKVSEIATPTTIDELQKIVAESKIPVSVGGGRFSMGGQTASQDTLHIDMRQLNKVVSFSKDERLIVVQAGIRWCDIQRYIDPQNVSVKIMQTYANFTVGGSLSVNCHGRYIGLGPIILSVKSIELLLANGELKQCSRKQNPELFYASIGCYNAIGIITQVELELEENIPVKRSYKTMPRDKYKEYFVSNIRENKNVIFHNGDIYPPQYKNVRAVSWEKTDEKPTVATRLMPLQSSYPIERYFIGAFSNSNFGKWRRENIIDPIAYLLKKVHWRNYEAGYDVLELEPESREKSTYVLQEYFVPVNNFDKYSTLMAEIFIKHDVNVINVSIRHALADDGSFLAWAKTEVFAFVVWYKQGTAETDKLKVKEWTRELIDAAIANDGSYYLPYQPHATSEQFHKAYPNAVRLFELKRKLDPEFKFRNVLWDTYFK